MINQIKDDSAKNRNSELRRNKEIAQLRKQQRQKESRISKLETEKRHKDIVLRRKQEEVSRSLFNINTRFVKKMYQL